MKILGEDVDLKSDYLDIYDLQFLVENPRVYASTHGVAGFDQMLAEERQEVIYKRLLSEPSVTKLLPEVVRHKGLIEPILVRLDTMEVVEGNSRLAVYRKLHGQHRDKVEQGNWELIWCNTVSCLTPEQQAAYLNQIHVKNKTPWAAYEKANYAYVQKKHQGWTVEKIAELAGVVPATIARRIKVIDWMKENDDSIPEHFSFYDVLIRDTDAKNRIEAGDLTRVLRDVKDLGAEGKAKFTAQELRKWLPAILKKPKVLKRYEEGKYDLETAYQIAEISRAEDRVKRATALLAEVSRDDIDDLDQNAFNALKQAVRKLGSEFRNLDKAVKRRDES